MMVCFFFFSLMFFLCALSASQMLSQISGDNLLLVRQVTVILRSLAHLDSNYIVDYQPNCRQEH